MSKAQNEAWKRLQNDLVVAGQVLTPMEIIEMVKMVFASKDITLQSKVSTSKPGGDLDSVLMP